MKIPKAKRLKSGNWFIQLRLDGQSIPITKPTRLECENAAKLLKAEYLNGKKIVKPTSITLEQAIRKYIDNKKVSLSPSTIRGYEQILNSRFKSTMPLLIGNISNWQKVIDDEAKIASAKTVRNAWGLVRSSLMFLKYDVPNVSLPIPDAPKKNWLEIEELKKFMSAIKGTKYELSILLALHGLRLSEILAVSPSDINLDTETITVYGAVVRGVNGMVEKNYNKTGTSTRTIPILIPRLKEALIESNMEITTFANDTLRRHINRICDEIGVTQIGVHGCRHTFASVCAFLGISMDTCQKWGGWKNPYTMQRIYRHILNEQQKREVELAKKFFGE